MAAADFELQILTPDKLVCTCRADYLEVPHPDGREAYLARHEATLKELAPGKIVYREPGSSQSNTIDSEGGWLVFSDNKAVLFCR